MSYSIDPELAAALPFLPDIDAGDPTQARRSLREITAAKPAPAPGLIAMTEHNVVANSTEVALRVYRPDARRGAAVIYHVHGGGFVMGDLETGHARNVTLASELGVVVVSVDYRLAPEDPYPAGLDDVYAGLEWIAAHASELDVDAAQVIVKGASAGAGLCAALTLAARDRNGPAIAFQFLACPELDDRLNTISATRYTDTPNWHRRNAQASWEAYLGVGIPGTAGVPRYAAPARAEDLTGLPAAYISVAHHDPLRDEGIIYAQRLLEADVSVELHLFPGTFHGSSGIDSVISRRQLDEEIAVLAALLVRLGGPAISG